MSDLILEAVQQVAELRAALQFHEAHKGVVLTGLANSAKSVFCAGLAGACGVKSKVFCVATRDEIKAMRAELEGW